MRFTIYLFSCLLCFQLSAQMEVVNRFEIPRKDGKDDDYEVFMLGKEGVLIQTERDISSYKAEWVFTKLDTDFKKIWETNYTIGYDMGEFTRSYQNQHFIFWLFTEAQSKNIHILRLDLSNGEQELFKGKTLDVLDNVSDFMVLGNQAFIGGELRTRAIIATFSFFDGSSKYLKGLYDKDMTLTNIETDEARNELQVTIRERKKNKCSLVVKTYSYDGELLRTLQARDEEGKSLISGRILPMSETEALLVGNYSSYCSNQALGFYVSKLKEGEVGQPQFVQFTELKNFFNFMKPKRQQRIKDKIERKKQEGKDFEFPYLLLINQLVPTEEGSVLIAEAYYSQQRTSGGLGGGIMRFDPPNRNPEEYKFTHVVLCGFDKEGKLIWDNCVKTTDLQSLDLDPQVQIAQQEGRWILNYVVKDKIISQVAKNDKVLTENQEFDLKYNKQIDEADLNQIAFWYDQTFLTFGTQRVNTGNEKHGNYEKRFCLTKLKYKLEIK